MGQKFTKKLRISRCCGRTPSNESLTNVSSLFGNTTLNSDTSVFSSVTGSLPKASNSNEDTKTVEEKVDTKCDSPPLSEHGSETKISPLPEDTEDSKEICICLCEPDSSNSDQNPLLGGAAKNTSSHSLNTESCVASELMCSSFITRTTRSLSSLVRLLDDTNDLFQCPCVLCSSHAPQTPSYIALYEAKLLKSAHSSSTDTSVSVSSNSDMSKTTLSTNFSDITHPSDNTSSLCRTESLSCTCTSKNSGSLSSSSTTSTTCTESSSYSSRSSNSSSSCDSNSGSSDGTARSSSSGISLCTLFGST